MARPKGAKSDPIGSVIVKAERDLKWAGTRIDEALKYAKALRRKVAILKRMGL